MDIYASGDRVHVGKRIRSDALWTIMLSIDQAAGSCIP